MGRYYTGYLVYGFVGNVKEDYEGEKSLSDFEEELEEYLKDKGLAVISYDSSYKQGEVYDFDLSLIVGYELGKEDDTSNTLGTIDSMYDKLNAAKEKVTNEFLGEVMIDFPDIEWETVIKLRNIITAG